MRLRELHEIATRERRKVSKSTLVREDFELRLWERFGPNPQIEAVGPETFNQVRSNLLAAEYAPKTIENLVATALTILRDAVSTGTLPRIPDAGQRLRVIVQPKGTPSLSDLSKAFEHAEFGPIRSDRDGAYWRAFFAVAYFTALRFGDLMQLRWDQIGRDTLNITANKTGKQHSIPIHGVMRRIVNEYRLDNKRLRPFTLEKCQFYRELRRICSSAGVSVIPPQSIRRLSALQFEIAHGGSGSVILGHALPGATRFYIPTPEILKAAIKKLAIPDAMLSESDRTRINDRESQLLLGFRSLPDAEKDSVLTIVRKMA
jgi:integrase